MEVIYPWMENVSFDRTSDTLARRELGLWTRCRYAGANCNLCLIAAVVGAPRQRTAPRAAVAALKRFEREPVPPRFTCYRRTPPWRCCRCCCCRWLLLLLLVGRFHLCVRANRLYEAGFCRNQRRDSRSRCDRRLWNADSFLLPIDATLSAW